ncbi:MAG: MarR family winged helix-turn-helix transcriptional regulator [Cetobacterium sp.]
MNDNLVTLISKLSRYQKKYLNNHLKGGDLDSSGAIVLLKIKENSNITPKDLFEIGIVEKPSVTKILKKLEELKYIKKSYSTTDKRSYSISITDKGKIRCSSIETVIDELNKVYKKVYSESLYEGLEKILDEVFGKDLI